MVRTNRKVFRPWSRSIKPLDAQERRARLEVCFYYLLDLNLRLLPSVARAPYPFAALFKTYDDKIVRARSYSEFNKPGCKLRIQAYCRNSSLISQLLRFHCGGNGPCRMTHMTLGVQSLVVVYKRNRMAGQCLLGGGP